MKPVSPKRKLQIYMAGKVSANFHSAKSIVSPNVQDRTFRKYCSEAGYRTEAGTITRRITALEPNCPTCGKPSVSIWDKLAAIIRRTLVP